MEPEDFANALQQVKGVLEIKNKAVDEQKRLLEEKEESFLKRVRLFEESNPKAGKISDVLYLNVGGVTNIAVLRSTLTQFEDSVCDVSTCTVL